MAKAFNPISVVPSAVDSTYGESSNLFKAGLSHFLHDDTEQSASSLVQ